MKRLSCVSLGDLRGFQLFAVKSWMRPLHKGFTTKGTKRTKVNKNEAHFLCVPWRPSWLPSRLPLFAVKSNMYQVHH